MDRKLKPELIPIGIPVIDEYIVGLPSDAVILIIGDPGSGFITFLHQLLVIRAKAGIPAIYTSLDKSRKEIKDDYAKFGWNIEDFSWQFNDLSPAAKQR